ncbi:MAG: bifunctional transcriptional activator/DNA repair enzyme AdaA [Alphaproteobacteria bacterium]
MLYKEKQQDYYDALIRKDAEYEGVFFAGIKTTGIFCRPTCPARKPKFENCEFFATAQDALLAGYRSCKRCHPMALPDEASSLIKTLIKAVEDTPEKRWKDADFRAIGVDQSTVRRHFKKRYGMTFVEYARARRMGLALSHIRSGKSVINAQIDQGYESDSGFRDAFSRIMGAPPSAKDHIILKALWIDTKLGPMVAIADDTALYLLEFTMRRGLELEIERMRKKMKAAIIPGSTPILKQIEEELTQYFKGTLPSFKTPVAYIGSDFQQNVWDHLREIPYGETCSYADLARAIDKPSAFRAVARANGSNQLALIIPCHRVIGSDGSLTGYAGGLARKEWLITHERKNCVAS